MRRPPPRRAERERRREVQYVEHPARRHTGACHRRVASTPGPRARTLRGCAAAACDCRVGLLRARGALGRERWEWRRAAAGRCACRAVRTVRWRGMRLAPCARGRRAPAVGPERRVVRLVRCRARSRPGKACSRKDVSAKHHEDLGAGSTSRTNSTPSEIPVFRACAAHLRETSKGVARAQAGRPGRCAGKGRQGHQRRGARGEGDRVRVHLSESGARPQGRTQRSLNSNHTLWKTTSNCNPVRPGGLRTIRLSAGRCVQAALEASW